MIETNGRKHEKYGAVLHRVRKQIHQKYFTTSTDPPVTLAVEVKIEIVEQVVELMVRKHDNMISSMNTANELFHHFRNAQIVADFSRLVLGRIEEKILGS